METGSNKLLKLVMILMGGMDVLWIVLRVLAAFKSHMITFQDVGVETGTLLKHGLTVMWYHLLVHLNVGRSQIVAI